MIKSHFKGQNMKSIILLAFLFSLTNAAQIVVEASAMNAYNKKEWS